MKALEVVGILLVFGLLCLTGFMGYKIKVQSHELTTLQSKYNDSQRDVSHLQQENSDLKDTIKSLEEKLRWTKNDLRSTERDLRDAERENTRLQEQFDDFTGDGFAYFTGMMGDDVTNHVYEEARAR